MLDSLSPFTNCTVVSFSGIGGDLCKADDRKLDIACSITPQLPRYFREASHAAKPFFFPVVFPLKVKKLQPSLFDVVERPEADGIYFSKADCG